MKKLVLALTFAQFLNACGVQEYRDDSNLEPSAAFSWKGLLISGDSSISAFDNGRKDVGDSFLFRGLDKENFRNLSVSRAEQQNGTLATSVANMDRAFQQLNIGNSDACAVFMTSHGSRRAFIIQGESDLSPSDLDALLDKHCGNRPTVLLISACYSGIFINDQMRSANRIILTAARNDRTSFGCSAENEYTYWDGCLIRSLRTNFTWKSLYENVSQCISAKESSGGFTPSEPQAHFGSNVENYRIF